MTGPELALIIATAVVAALIQSVSGMGYPLIVLPVLALFLDISDAIYISSFSNLALNATLAWDVRSHRDESPTLRPFLLASIVGGGLGALLLPVLSDRVLRLLLVTIVALFLVGRWRSPTFSLSAEQGRRLAAPVGGFAGLMQGAAGVSGPIVTPWFLSVGVGRQAFVFSITAVFSVSGLAQIVVLAAQGEFDRDVLLPGLLLVPIALLVLPIGVRLRARLSGRVFDALVITLLAASALAILARL